MWKEQKHELLTRESKTIYIHTFSLLSSSTCPPHMIRFWCPSLRAGEKHHLHCSHTPGLSNESNFQMQAGQGSPKAGCKCALLKHNCTKSLLWKKLVERENSRFKKKKKNLGTSSNSKRKRKWPILRGFLINGIFSIATGTMTGSFSNFVQSK